MKLGLGEAASGEDLGNRLIDLFQARDRLDLEIAVTAAAFAQTDEYDEQGSVSPIDWIRHNCHTTAGAAGDRVAVGANLHRLSESAQAMNGGEIGFAHLALMARTAEALPASCFDEMPLLEKARANSAGKFHYVCRHYRHAANPAAYAEEQAEQVENRRLSLSMWMDGTYLLSGVLDSAGGAALRTALEPLAKKSGPDDCREREQRMADALVEFVERNQPVQMQVTSSLETLLGLTGAVAADMEFSLPISSKTVERLACDCTLTRVLLGSESQVIDVGRSKRVVSGPGRKALEARDHHCVWPRCDRPAKWSAAHHVVHWIHGGRTDLDNLVLLCHRHHWLVHEGKWQLVLGEDGGVVAIPPSTAFGHLARGPGEAA